MTDLRGQRRRFRVRAAGVAFHEGRVLVSRAVPPSAWTNSALPGGGVGIGESSDAAVVREFREEIGVDVRTGRLLWCVENFFENDGDSWHELGFYWEVVLPPDFPHLGNEPFLGFDVVQGERVASAWQWCPLERLGEIEMKPGFLVEGLRHPPRLTTFLTHVDPR